MGYGVDEKVQVPQKLYEAGVPTVLVGFGRVEFLRLQQVVELDFGNVEVARNHHRDELAFEVKEHALGGRFGRDIQELGEIFDACAVRSFDLFECSIFVALERHALELRDFAVRLVAALLTSHII